VQNNFFCNTTFINLYEKPSYKSVISTQIIYGEQFKILSKKGKFFKIKTFYDDYIGYIKLSKCINKFNPTHKVKVIKSSVYKFKKNKKKKLNKFLTFASRVSILKKNKNYSMFEKNKWIKNSDLDFIKKKNKNYVKILNLFKNCKYKWGGKTFEGIDCSALIQIFYKFNNKFFPRDTRDQIKFKKGVEIKKKFKKGDLIFWKGHVALCLNSKKLIHAYGPEKKVILMPIQKTIKRIERTANLKVQKVFSI
tara:strand:- start:13680 stop:14429 length:750 start_codon:yes stop_codon:yes gene_type:complete